jgi:hypothetical protein
MLQNILAQNTAELRAPVTYRVDFFEFKKYKPEYIRHQSIHSTSQVTLESLEFGAMRDER